MPDLDRLALTRRNTASGSSRIRYDAPGWNFAYPADGPVMLTSRWNPEGYGKQVLLFQSAGVLVHHHGDREPQVVFWGPEANMATAKVIKATARGFVADDGTKDRTIEDLTKKLILGNNQPLSNE